MQVCTVDSDKLTVKTHNFNRLSVPDRTRHACCLFGSYMLVHGGEDIEGVPINDLKVLHLSKLRSAETLAWTSPMLKKNIDAVAGHACVAYFENSSIHLRSKDLQTFGLASLKVSHLHQNLLKPNEGIYFFGGRDGNNVANSNLWMLKIYQSPAEFIPVEAKGKKPVGRYGHSFNHIENTSYLVLFGGRNDDFFKILSYKTCFAFLDVLDVEKMQWLKVTLGGYKPSARFNFCSAIYGSRLFIFGGLTDENYLPAQMEQLEFDSLKVEQLIVLENKAKFNSGRKIVFDTEIAGGDQPETKQDDKKSPQIHLPTHSLNLTRLHAREDGSERTRSISLVTTHSPGTKSYLPVPKSHEERERHVHGFAFSLKPRPT